jgi:orotate phosphoribosyltransferase
MPKEWDGSPLFQFGDFSLASGKKSTFKLECDAVSPEEWHSLARIARPILPAYGYVIGVPRGGLAWANIFQHYVTPGAKKVLVVDDVWTTGSSMTYEASRNSLIDSTAWHGIVLFARGPVPKNVTALFMLNENLQ